MWGGLVSQDASPFFLLKEFGSLMKKSFWSFLQKKVENNDI